MVAISRMEDRDAVSARVKTNTAGFVAAGILLGIGLGGFIDGIVLTRCCSGTTC